MLNAVYHDNIRLEKETNNEGLMKKMKIQLNVNFYHTSIENNKDYKNIKKFMTNQDMIKSTK